MAEPAERDFEGSAELLRAIAHPVRLQILCAIKDQARAVSDIEEATGISQPGLSQQLAILRKADLVVTRREGKQVFYRVDSERMEAASDLLAALAGSNSVAASGSSAAPPFRRGGAANFARVIRD